MNNPLDQQPAQQPGQQPAQQLGQQLGQQPGQQPGQQLREQQRAFVAHVFDGEKPPSEFRALKHAERDPFSDDQRLQIYHNNIVIGLREALAGIYHQ